MDQIISRLKSLAMLHGTDKLGHGYIPFYEKHLPPWDAEIKILEIGVKQGASAGMWLDYFPNAQFHGLDLFQEHSVPFTHERATWWTGNQCDWTLLEALRKEEFDVIIDDGSHNSRDQMISFFGLFSGKSYFIEDTHCCLEEFYRQGLPQAATALGFLETGPFIKVHLGHDDKIIHIKCL